ncbi:lipoate--protein ligase family protein [Paenibacillus pinistramenti]|uniref:lipoate--protein ligase family protein n=1 Tax=Paenibacillus pinistramenti TaxID=1768003 RepID=UPI001EEFCC85|nr:lipoate--protein ligase family protein [Paenibacillus pinistramenti]
MSELPEEMIIVEAPLLQGEDILDHFAREEYYCRLVGEGGPPLLHLWRHPQAMVLGLRDRRLPGAPAAMERLRSEGWSVCVRPSGGAAVVLHPGVVNVSIILPHAAGDLNIHRDFARMAGFIRGAVQPWSGAAAAGEIAGAFCPGDYDISIGGRKFCGIAQRRQLKAYILTAFVIVSGQGDEMAGLVRHFYEEASCGQQEGFPVVRGGTMASLQELAGVPSAEAFTASLKQTAMQRFGAAEAAPEALARLAVPAGILEELKAGMRRKYDG